MRKILVTGGSGFLGSRIIQRIQGQFPDCEIWNLGRTEVIGTKFRNLNDDWLWGLPEFDAIVHTLALASDTYCRDFRLADEMNVELTKKLIFFAESQKSCRFIFLSTVVLYDNSTPPPVRETDKLSYFYNNYSFTKGVAEEYVRYRMQNGLRAVIFRVSNVYWPGQRFENSPFLVPEKIVQWLDEGEVIVRNGETKRDWLYVDDAVDAIFRTLSDNSVEGVFNLGSWHGFSAGEIWKIIASELGVPYRSLDLPASGPQNFFSDISKIKAAINWVPMVQLREGLSNTIRFIVQERWESQS